MSDGVNLRRSWSSALTEAEAHFRRLLTSTSPSDWKRVSTPNDPSHSPLKAKARTLAIPEPNDVIVHRKVSKSGNDVYRVILDVPTTDDVVSLDPWKAVLGTPEWRPEWDPAVEAAHLVEMFDSKTRICMTKFTLGWPANPRDAVTIARSFHDPSTYIDISTSLPRSVDEPAYLRPSPPYVRSNVMLFAWCIQIVSSSPQQSTTTTTLDASKRRSFSGTRIRVTCFWQHDLRAMWNFGSSSSLAQQLCAMVLGLLKTVKERGSKIPTIVGYGNGVSIERIGFQVDREALTIEYAIVAEEEEPDSHADEAVQGGDDLATEQEHQRLTRSIECALPSSEGWDVQLTTKAFSSQVEKLPWTASATKRSSDATPFSSQESVPTILKLTHASLPDIQSVLKVKVVVELSGTPGVLRLNGLPQVIQDFEEPSPSSLFNVSESLLKDAGSIADLSSHAAPSIRTMDSGNSGSSVKVPTAPPMLRTLTERSAAAEKSVLSRVKRNYIYFSSLLQEPEAKWKRTTEARGVSITQLDSIDPTLVVYRAEATFVGVGLWDLYGALTSPGARIYWDKQHDDAVLLEDANELTELWHIKTKPAWPVVGRDSVVLKTVYKSPTAIHVFSFSSDDPHLFPSIPPVDPNIIRTQIDLQGWAIEALSPTTTLLTLLEQSDPKGWTNKASIPQQMINSVAGVGEFAIKCGGPPVVTRLAGAKATELRYDHERGSFRVSYETSASRRPAITPDTPTLTDVPPSALQIPVIECEIRCDIDTWSSSLDIVVDPPPHSVTCFRRHRLSGGGGGLWLTLTHDVMSVDDERLLAIVRRGPGREKGLVMLNGAKVTVDVEPISEAEIKILTKQKRVKPARIPLDQPPVMGVIRRRRAEWNDDPGSNGTANPDSGPSGTTSGWAPKLSSPLARFFTNAVEQATTTTQQAVAAITPATRVQPLSSSKLPMQYALEASSWLQETHCNYSSNEWTLVSERGVSIHRKYFPDISDSIPLHRGHKVIEGVSADELSSLVMQYDCRKQWDDRFDSATVLEAYGAECHTSFVVFKGGFPFRERGFYLASLLARGPPPPSPSISRRNTGESEQSNGSRNAIFFVTSSFSAESITAFSQAKVNPSALPIGRIFVDGWIFETLDPYTTEKYAIPSTSCTRFVAVDYAGSVPAAVNSMINAALPGAILSLEAYSKTIQPLPVMRLPSPGLVFMENKTEEEFQATVWKLRRRDENRLLISTKYDAIARMYRSSLILVMPTSPPHSPSLVTEDAVTPKPSSLNIGDPSANADAPLNNGTISTTASPARRSGASAIDIRSREASPAVATSPPPRSSAFTNRGEIRQSVDLLVAEAIIDSKLYPDGYDILLTSRVRGNAKRVVLKLSDDPLQGGSVLPISCAVYTLPVSPLHSSGLNADPPTRHLLRLWLPTAQYQISTVLDPLTGEVQTGPPRPAWLSELQEKGAIVDVVVKPAPPGSKGAVFLDGTQIRVSNEKESLTTLGRDELQDDRMARMAVLSRKAGDANVIPEELMIPLAVAGELLDPSIATPLTAVHPNSKDSELTTTVSDGDENAQSNQQITEQRSEAQGVSPASTGLLGFFHSYPLSRFTGPPSTPSSSVSSRPPSRNRKTIPGALNDNSDHKLASEPGGSRYAANLYPLSTIVIVALISFLIGSLLRSLLSPIDFIHVVPDMKEVEDGQPGAWKEMKRLLEVKYIFGGWDFQVALVRRQ